MDDDQRYQAAASKDARFDGVFFTAVRTTGVYCRPSCPAITPKRANVTFYPTAAAAQQAGYRACKRCRPDASPGSPDWNVRSDVAGRAMRLIADGIVDRDGVPGLAARLGYSPRQVGRVLAAEVGAGPLALARAQRARTARILVETTTLPMGDIAFAAGFASIRQFNATMLEVYDTAPSVLRERAARRRDRGQRRGRRRRAGRGAVPAAAVPAADRPGRIFGYLAARAVPGVEVVTATEYAPDDQPSERTRGGPAADRSRPELGGVLARAGRPARCHRRRAAVPAPARPGRGPAGDLRFPGLRPGDRPAGGRLPRAALGRRGRRRRDRAAGRARPAGVGRGGAAAGGTAGGPARRARCRRARAGCRRRGADARLSRCRRRSPGSTRRRCRCRARGRGPWSGWPTRSRRARSACIPGPTARRRRRG